MTPHVAARGDQVATLRAHFRREFGGEPEGVWTAPGRVNLIGEHTDYNAGLVLPVAIDRATLVAVRRRDDDVVRAWSAQAGAAPRAAVATAAGARAGDWAGYLAGVVWALRDDGQPVTGIDIAVSSDVPIGAGLSSSAALSCATALAVTDLAAVDIDRMTLARAAQRAERDVVGAPVGLMDQMAALFGRRGAALLIDCRSLETDVVPLTEEIALVVIDTRVRHDNASGGYAQRRHECEHAARALGVASLRDAGLDEVDRLPAPLRKRARHVVTENDRVLRAVDALRSGEIDALGAVLMASHASLRDDFEVSVPQLDLAVAAAAQAGAFGARLTGGGFGGSVLALTTPDRVPAVVDAVRAAFDDAGFSAPAVHVVTSSDGARQVGAAP